MANEEHKIIEEHEKEKQPVDKKTSFDYGKIDLSFTENPLPEYDEIEHYPPSYYSLSNKERLILLIVEAFRVRFFTKYPKRQPLVLAVKNECNVQKFVCMTIRPTAFLFPKMIGCFEECCNFVADFITYEPLEDVKFLPSRLISPDTLIRRREGNSFEIATLLCSILIGEGFPAMIVSGIAKLEVALNDQRNVECPYLLDILEDLSTTQSSSFHNNVKETSASNFHKKENKYLEEEVSDPRILLREKPDFHKTSDKKYELKEAPDLTSRLDIKLQQMQKHSESLKSKDNEEEDKKSKKSIVEDGLIDRGKIHAWIVVVENVHSSMEIPESSSNVFFVEPSTGFRHEITTENYLQVNSVWNHENYYVNCQDVHISKMNWDLNNTEYWERLLPNKPPEFQDELKQIENQKLEKDIEVLLLHKHLDIVPSWVRKLHVSMQEYQERYRDCQKVIHFKKIKYERFSPYSQIDGLVTRATIFDDDDFENPISCLERYENRIDNLSLIKTNLETKQVEQYFLKGRLDKLKSYKFTDLSQTIKEFEFFHEARSDSLKECHFNDEKLVLYFGDRNDLCFYQEFYVNLDTGELKKIVDKFNRNENIPTENDVAERYFQLSQNKIIVKYHYSIGANIALKKEFTKPEISIYDKEIPFHSALVKTFKTSEYQKCSTDYENYIFLLQLLRDEKMLKNEFTKRLTEMKNILKNRSDETESVTLKFDMFDPLRNQEARNLHIKKFEEEMELKLKILREKPDYLAPYLIPYKGCSLNREQSRQIYDKCLKDIKSRYMNLLNKLQRKHEELTNEYEALEGFLVKYHHKLNDNEFEKFKIQKRDVEINKRTVQCRLVQTHQEAKNKYDELSLSLWHDPRLNLRKFK